VNNSIFWQGTLVGLISYKLLEKGIFKLLDEFRIFLSTKKKDIHFVVDNVDSDLSNYIIFGYNLVRYGTDEFLEKTATENEKNDAKLQNKVIRAKSSYDIINRNEKVLISLRIHKKFGVQFKIFVDVLDIERVDEVKSLLEQNDSFDDVKISNQIERKKIYFLLKEFSETTTPEGIRNNFIYPK